MKNLLLMNKQVCNQFLSAIIFVLMTGFGTVRAQNKATLSLGNLFQDHMVLQRDQPVNIWGFARAGELVTVSMNGNKVSVPADASGDWKAELPAQPHGGPYTILVSSGNVQLEINDVLMGDVWIASGQSNMEWPVKSTNFKETDSGLLANAEIRLLKVSPELDYQPSEEGRNWGWKKLSPEAIDEFSAVAYHFGKTVYRETGVPVGLISANLGATAIETWMSNSALEKFPQFPAENPYSFQMLKTRFGNGDGRWSRKEYYRGIGLKEGWSIAENQPVGDWKPIKVAGNTWEEVADLKDFDGAVWFRKRFDIPESFSGDSLDLQLLQIDDYDMTWVNGIKVGETFGKHNHRNYKIAVTHLRPTNNQIVVRVFDAGGIGGFTTNAFWGNELLWGDWEYHLGSPVKSSKFKGPELPDVSPFSSPGVLYNGTIAPLTALEIKGIIWYQGESNEFRADEYRCLFPELIRDWRKQFGNAKMPFLFVQLANYRAETEFPEDSRWAELREAQTLALNEPLTGMATAIDLGEAGDIHPKNKEDVGKRLAGLALEMVYEKDTLARSPQFEKMELIAGKAYLDFNSTGEGLKNRNKFGCIRGFQIAGADKKFYWATAHFDGERVVVWSPEVKAPVAVRYAWSDNPGELDLYNSSGLPLIPFRTDQWKLSTEGEVFKEGPRF